MLRFTIRDVLWLTAVVACATGWYSDRCRIDRLSDRVEAVEKRMIGTGAVMSATGQRVERLEVDARILKNEVSHRRH